MFLKERSREKANADIKATEMNLYLAQMQDKLRSKGKNG